MNKSEKHLPPTPLFFLGSSSLLTSLPPPTKQHRGRGRGGLQSVHHKLSLLLLPSSCSSSVPVWCHSHGATGPARKPAPVWAPLHSVTASFGCIRLLWRAAGCISALPWTSVGCRGTACVTMVFTAGCRGICFRTWITSSFSFLTDFGVCRTDSFCTAFFSPSYISQRCYQGCWLAQL